MEVINWIISHIDDFVEIYLGIVGAASVIVRLTPTLKDDNALKSIIRVMGKYVALNRK